MQAALTVGLASILSVTVLLLAPRTVHPGWRRPAFVLVLLAVDALLLSEVCGTKGPQSPAAAVLLAVVILLPLALSVYWWSAADALDAGRTAASFDVVERWLTLRLDEGQSARAGESCATGCER